MTLSWPDELIGRLTVVNGSICYTRFSGRATFAHKDREGGVRDVYVNAAAKRGIPSRISRSHRPAENGNLAVLETMLACGFDPNIRDKDGVTSLHRAAIGGHSAAVRALLQYGASVNAMAGMFSATPLGWAVEGRRTSKHGGADHVEVARLLIAAGSPLGWTPPEGALSAEGTLEGLAELPRAAERPIE
jgi:hypothetical protein